MCRRIVLMFAMVGAALAVSGRPAHGQAPPPALEFAAGPIVVPEVPEALVGGALRFYISPRVSIGPEFAHVFGEGHGHDMLTGNVTFDVFREAPTRRVIPFIVAGGGVFLTRQRFFNETFTATEGAFTAGGGIRARINERVFVGAEARVGWEAHFRLNGLVGIRLNREP